MKKKLMYVYRRNSLVQKILLTMRLTLFLMVLSVLSAFSNTYAQKTKLNLNVQNRQVKEVLNEIENQSEFFFMYDNKQINVERIVSMEVNAQTIDQVLEKLFEGTSINFKVVNRQILLFSEDQNSVFSEQTTKVSGKVSDSSGTSLPGVSVIVKGTTTGVITDMDGKYSLAKVPENATLQFSFVGMKSQEIVVGNKSSINVILAEDAIGIEEVVAIGYGTQKRESVTSSVSNVKGDELSHSASSNISNMIIGRMTGVTSIQDQGSPGNDQSRIYVRGLATTGNLDPLYIIDGIPRTIIDFQRLAPSDIESLSVLKDAAAAAVYGARGANGVVLITTNRGKVGETSLSYSFNQGFQKATKLPDYVDSYDYAILYNQALVNEGRSVLFSNDDIQKFKDGSDPIFHPNTDWMSILRGTAPMQQHSLTINGGTEKADYFVSFNYLNQKSLLSDENPELGFNRYNFRSNIDIKATNTTQISVDVSGYLGTQTEPGTGYGNIFENINRPAPVYAGKYPNGLYGPGYSARNGWASVTESGYQRRETNALLTRFQIIQEIPYIKGLSLKGIASFDYRPNNQKNWSLPVKIYNAVKDGNAVRYDQVGGFGNPSLSQSSSTDKTLLLEGHAIYDRSFGKHKINGLLLYSQQKYNYYDLSASRTNFLSDQLDIINTGGSANQQTSGNATQYRRQSIVGRADYAFDSRYLFEFSFRYDGSTLFAQGRRFGFFPALSAGWVMSEEKFMKKFSFLDFLKIRGSFGELGNDQISQYQYLTFYNFGTGVPMGTSSTFQNTVKLNRFANAAVTWEKSRKTNIGVEAKFLKDFSFEGDYFWENRNSILGQKGATIPATLGLLSSQLPFENFQKVNNKGFELVLGYRKTIGNGISVQTRFNFTHVRNKVIDIGEPSDKPDRIKQAGKPLYSRYGYKTAGFFQSQAEIVEAYGTNYPNLKPGDIHYVDLNGDKKINGEDITYIGSTNLPENIFGWQSTINFKGFEISMLWQAGTGNQQYFGNWMAKPFNQAGSALERHKDYWSPENRDAKFPRILTSSSWNYDNTSDFWLYDMRYLRLKNLEIAYSLPKSVVSKIKAQNIRIYMNGTNLLTFSKYSEVDPENTNNNGFYYPQQIVYNTGIQINF